MLSCDARLFPINIPQRKPCLEVLVHIKTFVPVRIQRLLYDRGCSSLFSSYCSYRERIWEPYDRVSRRLAIALDGFVG